jgi:hypothetical protein
MRSSMAARLLEKEGTLLILAASRQPHRFKPLQHRRRITEGCSS